MRFLILVFVIGLSCSTKKSDNDKEQIETQIIGFLTWYSNNHDSLSNKSINALIENIWRKPPDSTKPYKINFEKGEAYLDAFRKSGFISEQYVNNFRDYFKKCQADFEKNPQYFGPPSGFDFDLIFRMQDNVKSSKASGPEAETIRDRQRVTKQSLPLVSSEAEAIRTDRRRRYETDRG